MIELLTTAEMAEADRLTIAAGVRRHRADGKCRAGGRRRRRVAASPRARASPSLQDPATTEAMASSPPACWPNAGIASGCCWSVTATRLKGDAALAAQRWSGPCEPATPAALMPAEVVVDALFGAGLDRPVEGVARAMIEAMNAAPRVLAVDLPSGINGTTGAVMGVAVRAAETVTFFRRKIGHALLPGRLHCGTIGVADIGIGADVLAHIKPRCWVNDPQLWGGSFPVPRVGGTQIRPRPRRRGLRRAVLDRRGPAGGARRAARRRGSRHHRFAARRARWSTRRQTSP